MFGTGKKIVALLVELISEVRRLRIAMEEAVDIWRAVDRVTDPLGDVAPPEIGADEGETPPQRPRRRR